MTKRKGSRRREKKWEMGGIGSGTKSIKRMKRRMICDYEHQQNKFIFYASPSGQENWFKICIKK